MKRIQCYVTNICIKDGAVLHSRPSCATSYLTSSISNISNQDWLYNLSTEFMVPQEQFNLIACGTVKLTTLIEDKETDCFYNLGQEIITDRLIRVVVRQYLTANVYDINSNYEYKGFVLADLEF
jgi:hypothetical protein